jgi:hypothetical protein
MEASFYDVLQILEILLNKNTLQFDLFLILF